MKKPKKANRKLMAALLSLAVFATSIPQGTQAYAAEERSITEEAPTEALSSEEASAEEALSSEEASAEEALSSEEASAEETFSSEEASAEETFSSEEALAEETLSSEEALPEEEMVSEEASSEAESETEEPDEEALKTAARAASTARASSFSNVGGWNESIYAEIKGIADTDVREVSYSGAVSGSLGENDLNYLVRKSGDGVRIDIPGLKAGTYTLTVKVGQESELTQSGIKVYAYDRSGFAHFKYTDGVGAYNDDGTLKDNAVVLYVTDKNKNDVELTVGSITVKGIGNILNSVGHASNGNQGIIRELAKAGKPLVVRFIGTVSDSGLYKQGTFNAASKCLIDGLTAYSSTDNGGTEGDNGHMARIQSGKDITLEGIGYDAVIDGWGFHYIAQTSDSDLGKSFEVRNLTFINTPEDAIGMEGQQAGKNASSDLTASVERCWVHHNEFYCPHIDSPAESDKSEGDGSVDFKRGQYFTCSYNYFDSCHKTNLVGSADYSLQFNLTYHHNYWYMCKARGPLTRRANVHMYNNVWDMQTDYAENTRADAYIFSEYNLFYACKSPQAVEGGAIKSYHDSISSVIWNKGSAGTVVTDKSEYVPNNCQFSARKIKYDKFDTDSSQSYIPGGDYQLQTDFADMRKVIVSQTGVQEQNPRRPESVSKSEYSMIDRMAGSSVHKFDSLPQTLVPGKVSKTVYAFEVGAAFDLEIAYDSAEKSGVLLNEEGENLLTGSGSAVNLPAGRYMIQPENFQPGDAQKGTIVTFKEMTVSSLKLSQHDSNAHYHKWKLDASKSVAATCTEAGENVYICEGTGTCSEKDGMRKETVSALGHAYKWIIDKPATAEETGLKHQECTRCQNKTDIDTEIPKLSGGSSGSGDDSTGGSTAAGDYELYFTGKKPNGDTEFFTVANGNYKSVTTPVKVNDVSYSDGLKIEKATEISFSCNDGATLFMAFDASGKKVKIDNETKTTDDKGTLTAELSAGLHKITKGDSMNLFYVSLANGASSEVYYTLSFEYNYDDSPDAKTVQVTAGKSYASMAALVPESFKRTGYTVCGLYTDADCTEPVAYPYVVNDNATLYADWEESGDNEVTYSLIFKANGGSAVATVRISVSQIYEIRQKPTRAGYVFAGWYDALEGGSRVDKIDGSKLTGNYTVYAHWNALEEVTLTLDCSRLAEGDITEKTNLNGSGFIAHALAGGGGSDQTKPKYYMTVKNSMLYTNGVRIDDKSITGNEDGMLKAIEFTTEGPGVLLVETALSGKPETGGKYELVLAKKTSGGYEEAGRSPITTGTAKTTKEFDISGAGRYYLYAEGDKGIVYYSLKVTEQVYTIVYDIGNGTAPEDLKAVSFTAKAGDTLTLPSDCIPEAGYVFKGWSVDDGATILEDVYIVSDEDAAGGLITITALYEAKQEGEDPVYYTVTLDTDGGTLADGGESERLVLAGSTIDPGKCEKAGYEFKGWTIDGKDVEFPYTVTGDVTLKAKYELNREGIYIVGLEAVYDYTGAKIIPNIGVMDYDIGDGKMLAPGTDYTVQYKNNVNPGFASVTVKGKGNYAGQDAERSFEIRKVETVTEPESLKGVKIAKIDTVVYSGAGQHPAFTLIRGSGRELYTYDENAGVYKAGETPIKANVALSNNVNKGTATILLTGANDDKGKPTKIKGTFKITAVDLQANAGKIAVEKEAGTYAVKGAAPKTITVKYDGRTLINGTDYTVKYSSNKKAGQAGKFVITGKGNYAKKYTGTYDITQLDLKERRVEAVNAYDGIRAGKVTAVVTDQNGAVLKTAQYQLNVYKDNVLCDVKDVLKKDDIIEVEAVAKDTVNLTGQTSKEKFTVGSSIAKAKITINKGPDGKTITKAYTGSPVTLDASDLTVTVRTGGKEETLYMGADKDYVIASYENNTDKGTATAVIQGVNSYSGTKKVKFKIAGKTIKIKESTAWDDIFGNFKSFMKGLFH